MKPYERLKSICERHGTTVTKFCGEIKKSKGNLATWKKGNFSASDLKAIHERFGVSTDWLLFGYESLPDYERHGVNLPSEYGLVKIVGICSATETQNKQEFYEELVNMLEKKGVNVTEISKLEDK